ncbi:MAG: hypothetical protein M3321_03435 [Actinomycetota bacterium]|nr:hypothetical protein [Actinomycetota bacterium]
MRRTRILLSTVTILVATALVANPSARAKGEITKLRVCGDSGCTTITERVAIRAVMTEIGSGEAPAAPLGSFYVLVPEPTPEWRTAWPRYVYVPAANAVHVRWNDGTRYWTPVARDSTLFRLTRGRTPYRAPTAWEELTVRASGAIVDTSSGSGVGWRTISTVFVVAAAALLVAGGRFRTRQRARRRADGRFRHA